MCFLVCEWIWDKDLMGCNFILRKIILQALDAMHPKIMIVFFVDKIYLREHIIDEKWIEMLNRGKHLFTILI